VAPGFFPLDEELELLPGGLSPWLYENLTRLGTWMPFPRAAEMLAAFTRVVVSDDVARDRTEAAGAAQVALQTAEVERLERQAPPAPAGPAKQYLSADGAFVPLVGGEWGEVKSVVIGEVGEPVLDAKHHAWVVHTHHLSYFSRLATADTFDRLALVETHRRGWKTRARSRRSWTGLNGYKGLRTGIAGMRFGSWTFPTRRAMWPRSARRPGALTRPN